VPGNNPDLGVSAGGCHLSQSLMTLLRFQSGPSRSEWLPCRPNPRTGSISPVARKPPTGISGTGFGDSHSETAGGSLSARL
jgi:hypothetical protein